MHDAVRRPMIRTFHHEDFAAEQLAERKARDGHVVSVCLPARNEAATVGAIVDDHPRDARRTASAWSTRSS